MEKSKPFSGVLPSTGRPHDRTTGTGSLDSADQSNSRATGNATSQPAQLSTNSPNNSISQVTAPSVLSVPVTATLNDVTGPSTGKGGRALRSINERKEFQPVLELSCNSGSGNGPFGVRWQLGCGETSAVTRKTSKAIPKYDDESDVFLLGSAEDLVLADGQSCHSEQSFEGQAYFVQQFRSRVEAAEFQLFERWTNVQDPGDNRGDQSRVYEETSVGRKRIFSWLFCESYDVYGKAMVLTYKAENNDGICELPAQYQICEASRDIEVRKRARYLKFIKYANRTPYRDLETWNIVPRFVSYIGDSKNEWNFGVVLDYENMSNSNPLLTYRNAGWYKKIHTRLTRAASSTLIGQSASRWASQSVCLSGATGDGLGSPPLKEAPGRVLEEPPEASWLQALPEGSHEIPSMRIENSFKKKRPRRKRPCQNFGLDGQTMSAQKWKK
ncbi:hypothetical protein FPHYL_11154 [Fusarium phyllophilum]|uniref:Uncharacterized protein n=1 Tax=Fusarium phyllophilum TaxID=47803 RepID=A0A8H5MWZ9_9HYPO|nr:hypothetical protein FPHYL_11154 [Fusarium phyllophilum]